MEKTEWIELGAVALGGLALFLVLSRGGGAVQSQEQAIPSDAPRYLGYNQNNGNISPPTDLADFNGQGTPCQCGGAQTITFSNDNAFAQALQGPLAADLGQYEQNVLSQYPDYVRQFFNNPTALADEAAAQTRFASLGAA